MSKKINLIDLDKIKFENYCFGGVWALFGKRKNSNDDNLYCLQVAETNCIRREIERDINYINNNKSSNNLNESKIKEKKLYKNQFKEKLFDLDKNYKKWETLKLLYSKEIPENFKDLKFLLIYKSEYFKERKLIEKYFAYKTRAVYWRNGGQYKDVYYLQINKNRYLEEKGKVYTLEKRVEFSKGQVDAFNDVKSKIEKEYSNAFEEVNKILESKKIKTYEIDG